MFVVEQDLKQISSVVLEQISYKMETFLTNIEKNALSSAK